MTFVVSKQDGRYELLPPWYAGLWPEALVLGLALLFLPWARKMPHVARVACRAVKTAYGKGRSGTPAGGGSLVPAGPPPDAVTLGADDRPDCV